MSITKMMESIKHLTEMGLALSREKDINHLTDLILCSAKELTNADGGTLYLTSAEGNCLQFKIFRNESLNIRMGGSSGVDIDLNPIPLFLTSGEPNLHNVSAAAANLRETINVEDAYHCINYDFSGTLNFDKNSGYRSKSFLTVPMKNHEGDMIGVLQLINARNKDAAVRAFSPVEQCLVESLTSMAATAVTQRQLIDAQEELFDAIVKLIAKAIDAKSQYTSAHCQRVPILADMLATACNQSDYPTQFTPDELYELEVAAWLHDCGKLSTPDYIMDKRTKLDGLNDRISEVETRVAVSVQEQRANYWEQLARTYCHDDAKIQEIEQKIQDDVTSARETVDFLNQANHGDDLMTKALQSVVHKIAEKTWSSLSGSQPLLTAKEVELLNITRGTLSVEERNTVNDHIMVTIDMLNRLPYPKKLKQVVEIAGGHHERMDGKGYPNGLTKDQLSVRARILAIVDVFEALTATDRPYKQPKTLSETLAIMDHMVTSGHIDAELYQLFLDKKVHLDYAQEHLAPEQIDLS